MNFMELETLIKNIEGTADHLEKKALEGWLSGSVQNSQYLNRVRKAWFALDDLKGLSKIDVNKDWEKIEKKISGRSIKSRSGPVRKMNLPLKMSKIAAVLISGVLVSGLVFYTSQKFLAKSHAAESFYEFNIPDGQRSDLVLPDGTKIMVNAGSKLSFSKEFDQDKREIWLEGEAFFEVAKNTKTPFFVHTSGISIKVLGTTFNVRAYADEKLIETTLVEGQVMLNKMTESGKPDRREVALEPNHMAVFLSGGDARISSSHRRAFAQPFKIKEIMISKPINPETITSWTKGKLIFENESFDVIVSRLEKYYGVQILIEDETLKGIKYTGTLKKISIDQALKALQLTTSFNCKMNESTIILTKNTTPMMN